VTPTILWKPLDNDSISVIKVCECCNWVGYAGVACGLLLVELPTAKALSHAPGVPQGACTCKTGKNEPQIQMPCGPPAACSMACGRGCLQTERPSAAPPGRQQAAPGIAARRTRSSPEGLIPSELEPKACVWTICNMADTRLKATHTRNTPSMVQQSVIIDYTHTLIISHDASAASPEDLNPSPESWSQRSCETGSYSGVSSMHSFPLACCVSIVERSSPRTHAQRVGFSGPSEWRNRHAVGDTRLVPRTHTQMT
jgi:hypothetical protein